MPELTIVNKKIIYENIPNYRKRNSGVVDSSKSLEQLNITSIQGDKFCLYDSEVGAKNRIVILVTLLNLSHHQNSQAIITYETFRVFPSDFGQYVIHGQVKSNVYLLVYILFKTKNKEDYYRAFEFVDENVDSNFPKHCSGF